MEGSNEIKDDEFMWILREFIDFINLQVGMYSDACSSFAGNRVRIERQVMRVSRPTASRKGSDGGQVIMHASFEDPSQPAAIHQRIIKAKDYILENSPGGLHEQQLSRSVVVFLFTYWETEIRPRLAQAKGVGSDEILSDILGDLRILRISILHKKGILDENDHLKMKKLGDIFERGQALGFRYEVMQKIFVLVKQDIARLIFEHNGQKSPPIKPEELRDLAMQFKS